MNEPEPDHIELLPTAAVERETGLAKETLRAWERRYGFPRPVRQGAGERAYSVAEVDKLRLVKRLIDAGHRPSRLVGIPTAVLTTMVGHPPLANADEPEIERCVDLLKSHDLEALRERLMLWERHEGLARFVVDLVARLNTRVADAWMRGELRIFQAHAYTELVQGVLRCAIDALPATKGPAWPRVLAATFPGEPHSVGLLMAEAKLRFGGAHCTSLGVQTPVWDISGAAVAYRSDVVVIGSSGSMNPNHVVVALSDLRAKLPATVELWAAGSAPVLHRRRVDGVTPLATLGEIGAALDRWRSVH